MTRLSSSARLRNSDVLFDCDYCKTYEILAYTKVGSYDTCFIYNKITTEYYSYKTTGNIKQTLRQRHYFTILSFFPVFKC